jgi:predicted DNA-binding transcriptional regulator AlpA
MQTQGMLRMREAAQFCGIGLSTWARHDASGRIPEGIKVVGSKCWGREELEAWIAHGCPPRVEWEPIWQKLRAKRHGG